MKTPTTLFLALLAAAHAGPRTSANYTVPTDITDSGGNRSTSTSYTNDGTAGGVVGISTVATPAEMAKHGYVGQLYDITGLALNSTSLNSTVNETATLQLAAWQLLDDASFLAVAATTVSWGVVSGPVAGISAAGLATAGTVPQNTAATVQGAFGAFTGALNFTVLDTLPDNFGLYAGDGIDDAWQAQNFGLGTNGQGNPAGAANADASSTGQTNRFKYIAGLNPLDPNARFIVTIAPVPGQPAQQRILFSPRFTDRTYTVKYRTDLLTGTWQPLATATQADNGAQRTVTDTGATEERKFYRIEITKP